jgi:hypothetical protein
MFKDFLLNDMKIVTVTERDLDVFLKTHPKFGGREVIQRSDMKIAFSNAF